MHTVNLPYTRQDVTRFFALARAQDVDAGGRYDSRSAAILLWSHPWHRPELKYDSAIIGTWYVRWDTSYLTCIECEAGFDLDVMLRELATLETQALGRVIHGRPL
jgi:hypothetical protein